MRINTFISDYGVHVILWLVIFVMPFFFTGVGHEITFESYMQTIVPPLSFMAVFYLNYLFFIDRFLYRQKTLRFVLVNIVSVALIMYLVHVIFKNFFAPPDFGMRPEPDFAHMLRFRLGNVMIYLLVVCASVAVRMTATWYNTERERQIIEKDKAEAELMNLKSQLNPHFLFNTLNNIYVLIDTDSEKAREALYSLSGLLRYVLYGTGSGTVPLKNELDFVSKYVELMKIRLPDSMRVRVSMPENDAGLMIAPLIFISLVENAFKHGISNDSDSFVDVDISLFNNDTGVKCVISNSNYPKSPVGDRSGSGIGLENLKRRLDLIYPDRYIYETSVSDGVYSVQLVINLM